ncbi:MAG: hypothetical protein QOH91_2598 [Mycobacterium sp.]|jgi:hypothetical protein|nr:hypothetical protein [Mycobacterium sp.]
MLAVGYAMKARVETGGLRPVGELADLTDEHFVGAEIDVDRGQSGQVGVKACSPGDRRT